MAPYFRFPETEVIRQKFWGFRPRNPTCGKISLETGTKIFAWGNMFVGGFMCVVFAFLLFLVPYMIHHTQQEAVSALKTKNLSQEEWIEKIHLKPFGILQFLVFCMLLAYAAYWYCSYKLYRAAKERDLPQLKKYYVWAIVIVILAAPTFIYESEIAWSKAFLFDIPIFVFQIMGAMFTHAYIVSLMNPDGSPHDDVQFNV